VLRVAVPAIHHKHQANTSNGSRSMEQTDKHVSVAGSVHAPPPGTRHQACTHGSIGQLIANAGPT
jgi:hypothetical protein